MNRWIRCGIYTMEYYWAIEKNEIMPFAATWMDLEIIIPNEVSQTGKDKYHMISLHTESKKLNKWINITKQKQTHRFREQICMSLPERGVEKKWYEREKLRGTNFQLQNKWVMGMKCTAWGIQSIAL